MAPLRPNYIILSVLLNINKDLLVAYLVGGQTSKNTAKEGAARAKTSDQLFLVRGCLAAIETGAE